MMPNANGPVPLMIAFVLGGVAVAYLAVAAPRHWLKRTGAASRYVWWGVATFFLFQMATRLPLVAVLSAKTTAPQGLSASSAAILAAVLLSFSAGLFEEVGRYLMLRFACKPETGATHAWNNAVAFGLGHGALEAVALCALPYIAITIALSLRFDSTPPEFANVVGKILQTPAYMPFVAIVERAMAMGMHASLAVLVARGINSGRAVIAVLIAIGVHGLVNLIAIALMQAVGWWAAELAVAFCVAGLLAWAYSTRGEVAFN